MDDHNYSILAAASYLKLSSGAQLRTSIILSVTRGGQIKFVSLPTRQLNAPVYCQFHILVAQKPKKLG